MIEIAASELVPLVIGGLAIAAGVGLGVVMARACRFDDPPAAPACPICSTPLQDSQAPTCGALGCLHQFNSRRRALPARRQQERAQCPR